MSALEPLTGGAMCPSCGQLGMAGFTHVCITQPNPAPAMSVTMAIDYEKEALRGQVQGLISYVAELRKHLHHHVVCLRGKNRNHTRSGEECGMCRMELADLERLLALHYKSGTVG